MSLASRCNSSRWALRLQVAIVSGMLGPDPDGYSDLGGVVGTASLNFEIRIEGS